MSEEESYFSSDEEGNLDRLELLEGRLEEACETLYVVIQRSEALSSRVLFTVGNGDRDIDRYSGRQSLDGRSTLCRDAVDSRSRCVSADIAFCSPTLRRLIADTSPIVGRYLTDTRPTLGR